MLIIKHSNITVNPQRPDAPTKTFGSEDVPHGTDSVMYKAAKILVREHKANLSLPTFKPEEIKAKIAAKKSVLTVTQLTENEELTQKFEIKDGNTSIGVFDLSTKDMLDKIDELMGKYPVRSQLKPGEEQKQKTSMPGMLHGMPGSQTYCATEQAAKDKILDEKKDLIAKYIVEKRIAECLDVPELSAEFKAQFTSFEAPAIP